MHKIKCFYRCGIHKDPPSMKIHTADEQKKQRNIFKCSQKFITIQ